MHRPPQAYAATWAEVDRLAWDAICRWPEAAGFEPLHQGLDYGELTRWFLWDKVGRSIRKEADPEGFAFEVRELGWRPEACREASTTAAASFEPPTMRVSPLRALRKRLRGLVKPPAPATPLFETKPGQRRVLVPVPTVRTARAAASLAGDPAVAVVTPENTAPVIQGARTVPYPRAVSAPDWSYVTRLYTAILAGLRECGTPLLAGDAVVLREQLEKQARHLQTAAALVDVVRPEVMLLHADNHPSCQYYVMIGQLRGIPSVMLQHGLDCERYYLDEAYADAIAVWGVSRKVRYERDSTRQPRAMAVTGNPEYDQRRFPEQLDRSGEYWLWVSRPHSAEKCYAPSRSPREGLLILEALLACCASRSDARLIVKPHPYDTIEPYREMVAASGLGKRVEITDTPPLELFDGASVVFTEDSTAGMEAMFVGKPVIHVHFAATPPTVPFVDYGAALPGFSPDELGASLDQLDALDAARAAQMVEGQRRFLSEFAGPCDGHAAERVTQFVLEQGGMR